ncbi:cell envelope integrity protein CreD [Bacteroidia bacterium]|nr:cell envelope integrity protein CreD [Bacteroidia bacterium]GHV45090.1 cell envelope integrity protein CreD [Bacteroidia bacterium]
METQNQFVATSSEEDLLNPTTPPTPPKKKRWWLKILLTSVFVLVSLIPMAIILNMIEERQSYSKQTIEKIAGSWGKEVYDAIPYLNVPYSIKNYYSKGSDFSSSQNIKPDKTTINLNFSPETRHYSIYKCVTYTADVDIEMEFNLQKFQKERTNAQYSFLHSQFVEDDMYVTEHNRYADYGTQNTEIENIETEVNGIKTPSNQIAAHLNWAGNNVIKMKYQLKGNSAFHIKPSGKNIQINANGAWGDIGFGGTALPNTKEIGDSKFAAQYKIDKANSTGNIDINFITTVDQYQQCSRVVKYSFLFILLTFIVFFLVEIISKKNIHTLQYLLVAVALLLFYSLLLSVSEFIGFAFAYLVAAFVIVLIISIYFQSIVKNWRTTSIVTTIFALLYAYFYVLLQLEIATLLVGSITLIFVLCLVMFITQKYTVFNKK